MRKSRSFDIALAGIGIGGFERTTLETLQFCKSARIIFHLTSYHRTLKKYCKQVVNLEKEYWSGGRDTDIYSMLTEIVLQEAKRGPRVVVVGDGHPAYYDDVTWNIYRKGKRRGFDVRILPAISSIDSMAAHCGLEIDASGLQIFEAPRLSHSTKH
jgi:precorrin-6B methylase 1